MRPIVDTFVFKGYPEPITVYRIEQTHRMRVIIDQYIVVTDLHGLGALAKASSVTSIEKILDQLIDLVRRVCLECSGTSRFSTGDSYSLTFPEAGRAMAAVDRLAEGWGAFQRHEGIRCPMNIAVHKGVLYAFRSFLLSADLDLAANLESATNRLVYGDASIFVTEQVRTELLGTPWDERLQPVDIGPASGRLARTGVYRLLTPHSASH